MRFKFFFFTSWLLTLLTEGRCQDFQTTEILKDNIVAIHEGNNGEVGTGFIIALKRNEVFIVTANHVVGKKKTVQVQISKYEGSQEAEVKAQSVYYDVALISVRINSFQWRPYSYATNILAGDAVYIMSTLQNKQVVPGDGSGTISDMDSENMILKLRGIQGGDSGTPLLCKEGVIGMIFTRSPVQAVPILLIRKLVVEDWQSPWQLTEKTIYRAPVKAQPPPDINKENNVPIARVSVIGDCSENTNNVADQDTYSYWSCLKDGWKHVLIHLDGIQTVRKLKVFYPRTYNQDLPKGEIEIPELKKSFSMEKKLTGFVEKDPNGTWYVYDLGNYYTIKDININLKVKKDISNDVITEVRIYEIKITGPKSF